MDKLGWAIIAISIVAIWAFLIYGIVWLGPKIWVMLQYFGRCRLCGMPNEYPGHWPGCDHWRGENLDLLIFKETDSGNPN